MTRQFYISVVFVCSTFASAAQPPLSGCPKVFYASSQVTDSSCDSTIRQVRYSLFGDQVVIKHYNGTKSYVPTDSVWGIRRQSDYPNRRYLNDNYKLYALSPLFKYRRTTGRTKHYYFSTSLDSPLYSYNRNQLKKHIDSSLYASIALENNKNLHLLEFGFFGFNTSMFNTRFSGGGLDFRYYVSEKISTGFYVALAGKQLQDTFGFAVKKPLVTFGDFGWLTQFDFLQKKKFRAGVTVLNGLAYFDLRDKAIKERVNTSRGYKDASKKIAQSYYYLFEPGVDLAFRIFSGTSEPGVFLNFKTKYRVVAGSGGFGENSQASGLSFAMGISLIGLNKEKF